MTIKKQGIGTWICLLALVFALIGLILYGTAVRAGDQLQIASGSEFFYDMARPEDSAMPPVVVPCAVIAILFLAAALVLGQFRLEGTAGKVRDICVGLLRIAAPALLVIALFYFLYGSFTGIGWTFFSNAELAIYPEATAVGKQVVTGLVFFALAMIGAAMAAYFEIPKKTAE